MNVDVYIWGQTESGLSVSPNISQMESCCKQFQSLSKAKTQLIIHRDNNLMYYAYNKELTNKYSLGFCLVFNGTFLIDPKALFPLFEQAIEYMANGGLVVQISSNGELVYNENKLSLSQSDITQVVSFLRSQLTSVEESMRSIPSFDYSMQANSTKEFFIDDDQSSIVSFSNKVGYVVVYKDVDYNSIGLNSSVVKIKKLNEENGRIREMLENCKKDYSIVVRKQKQYKTVGVLLVVLLIAIASLYGLYNNLYKARTTIESKDLELSSKEEHINDLEYNVQEELRRRESLEDKINNMIDASTILLIRSCYVDFENERISIDYYGLQEEEITIAIKVYSDYGSLLGELESPINVMMGNNSISFNIGNGFNSSEYYHFVVYKGNTIIGGVRA